MNTKGYQKIEGVVLKTLSFKETSQIVYLFTRDGIKAVVVKGAKNYKSAKLSFCIPLTKVEAITTVSDFPTLVDYTIIEDYAYLKNDLKKSLWSQFLLGIVSNILETDYSENIFNMLNRTFFLAKNNDISALVLINMVKLLKAFGVEPNFNNCVICANKDISFFSIKDGGALCINHKSDNTYDKDTLNILKEMYYINLNNNEYIKEYDVKKISKVVFEYYSWHVYIKLKHIDSLIF